MPVTYPEIRKFAGLFLQRNSFNVPDGALEQAENVVISQDETIQKRRGFYQYFDSVSSVLSNVTLYRNNLVGIFSTSIKYFTDTGTAPNQTGTATAISGSISVTSPRKARTLQANNNLYVTTDNGVVKVENLTGEPIRESGIPPAIDIEGVSYPDTNVGPVLADTQVSYRACFGRRDSNENLLLGAPSQRFYYSNPKLTGSTVVVHTGVATVVTPSHHNLIVGSILIISGYTGGQPDVNGTHTVATIISDTSFTFTTAASNFTSVTVTVAVDRQVLLQIGIPYGIDHTSGYFCQIYRTSPSASATALPLGDWALLDEVNLNTANTSGFFTYVDNVDELFRASSVVLYTNENSAEGEAQANYRAPLCADVTYFRNYAIYGNCATRHLLNLAVVATDSGANGDTVSFKVGSNTYNYTARVGYGNILYGAYQGDIAVASSTELTITTPTAHGYQVNDVVIVSSYIGGGTFADGSHTVTAVTTFTFTLSGGVGLSATPPDEPKFFAFWAKQNSAGNKLFTLSQIPNVIGADLANTARGIVKAVNRDTTTDIYALYTSLEDKVPGQFWVQGNGFVDTIFAKASIEGMANCFAPTLPTSFVGSGQVFSTNDQQPNAFFSSKVLEPEAVPLPNMFPVGSRNAAILRIVALRDSMIVIKQDGVYRVTGTSPSNFETTILDNTVFCVAADSVVVLNNFLYMLSNQGVVRISETNVEILSRKIENVIAPILGQTNLSINTSAAGYESERQYYLSTTSPTDTNRSVTYVYNYINDTWTTSTQLFKAGTIGPNNQFYQVDDANDINKERKSQNRIDYCGQNYATSVSSIDADAKGAVIISNSVAPVYGDLLELTGAFSRIISVVSLGGTSYHVRFARTTFLASADTPILYQGYDATVKLAPIHGGLLGRAKQFSQMQIHLRDSAITLLDLFFTNAQYGGSASISWDGTLLGANGGWGAESWGFFAWGQPDGILNSYSTSPANIIRIYIPLVAQRSTYIQPVFIHSQAGEPMDVQAISLAVRAYNERVSK